MRLSILLTTIVSFCVPIMASAQDRCTVAERSLNLQVPLAHIFSTSRGLDSITFKSKGVERPTTLAKLVPNLRADFSGLNYLVRGHGRSMTQAYFVLDSDLFPARSEDMTTILNLEKSYDDKLRELILVRKKVGSEFTLAVKQASRRGELDSFDRMVDQYRYLTVPRENMNVPAELLTIQKNLTLYLKTDQWIKQMEEQKRTNVTNHPLMVDLRRQQQRLTEKISEYWNLVAAGCHNSESRYQVYENWRLKGAYLVLEIYQKP